MNLHPEFKPLASEWHSNFILKSHGVPRVILKKSGNGHFFYFYICNEHMTGFMGNHERNL
jgi:hypothetical protein